MLRRRPALTRAVLWPGLLALLRCSGVRADAFFDDAAICTSYGDGLCTVDAALALNCSGTEATAVCHLQFNSSVQIINYSSIACIPSPGCEVWIAAPVGFVTVGEAASLKASTLNISGVNITVGPLAVLHASALAPYPGGSTDYRIGNGGTSAGSGGQMPCGSDVGPSRLSIFSAPPATCCDGIGAFRAANLSQCSFSEPVATWDLAYGSPGGAGGASDANASSAGAGGGRILLHADQVLFVDGVVAADGGGPNTSAVLAQYAGAGSGGTVVAAAPVIVGDGFLTANGGAASSSGDWAAGGGGRLALYFSQLSAALSLQATGGSFDGAEPGSTCLLGAAGTVYMSAEDPASPTFDRYNVLRVANVLNVEARAVTVIDIAYPGAGAGGNGSSSNRIGGNAIDDAAGVDVMQVTSSATVGASTLHLRRVYTALEALRAAGGSRGLSAAALALREAWFAGSLAQRFALREQHCGGGNASSLRGGGGELQLLEARSASSSLAPTVAPLDCAVIGASGQPGGEVDITYSLLGLVLSREGSLVPLVDATAFFDGVEQPAQQQLGASTLGGFLTRGRLDVNISVDAAEVELSACTVMPGATSLLLSASNVTLASTADVTFLGVVSAVANNTLLVALKADAVAAAEAAAAAQSASSSSSRLLLAPAASTDDDTLDAPLVAGLLYVPTLASELALYAGTLLQVTSTCDVAANIIELTSAGDVLVSGRVSTALPAAVLEAFCGDPAPLRENCAESAWPLADYAQLQQPAAAAAVVPPATNYTFVCAAGGTVTVDLNGEVFAHAGLLCAQHVELYSTLAASGLGCPGGYGAGAGAAGAASGGGAGHGGSGGASTDGGTGGAAYDSAAHPSLLGSGGGSAQGAGGAGGGYLALVATQDVTLQAGAVLGADGEPALATGGGGGSGGSLLVQTNALAGAGTISARGGAGTDGGGGGSGGRLALSSLVVKGEGEGGPEGTGAEAGLGAIAQNFAGAIALGGGAGSLGAGNGSDGSLVAPPCPAGQGGLPVCAPCGPGYWRNGSADAGPHCAACANAPPTGEYTDAQASGPACAYACPAGYLFPLCESALQELLAKIGGPAGFAGLMAGLLGLLLAALAVFHRLRAASTAEFKRSDGVGIFASAASSGGGQHRRGAALLSSSGNATLMHRTVKRSGVAAAGAGGGRSAIASGSKATARQIAAGAAGCGGTPGGGTTANSRRASSVFDGGGDEDGGGGNEEYDDAEEEAAGGGLPRGGGPLLGGYGAATGGPSSSSGRFGLFYAAPSGSRRHVSIDAALRLLGVSSAAMADPWAPAPAASSSVSSSRGNVDFLATHAALQERDLPRLVGRLYLGGTNTFGSSWRLPLAPPAPLRRWVRRRHFALFAHALNAALSWRRWGWEECACAALSLLATPAATYLHKWRKRVRVLRLARLVLAEPDAHAWLRGGAAAAALGDTLRLGVSGDGSLAFIDVLAPPVAALQKQASAAAAVAAAAALLATPSPVAYRIGDGGGGGRSAHRDSSSRLLRHPACGGRRRAALLGPRLPLGLVLAGDGTFESPLVLDPNDALVRAVPGLPGLARLIDNDWVEFVAEFNARCRCISAGAVIQTCGPALAFLKAVNADPDLLGGLSVELVRYWPCARSLIAAPAAAAGAGGAGGAAAARAQRGRAKSRSSSRRGLPLEEEEEEEEAAAAAAGMLDSERHRRASVAAAATPAVFASPSRAATSAAKQQPEGGSGGSMRPARSTIAISALQQQEEEAAAAAALEARAGRDGEGGGDGGKRTRRRRRSHRGRLDKEEVGGASVASSTASSSAGRKASSSSSSSGGSSTSSGSSSTSSSTSGSSRSSAGSRHSDAKPAESAAAAVALPPILQQGPSLDGFRRGSTSSGGSSSGHSSAGAVVAEAAKAPEDDHPAGNDGESAYDGEDGATDADAGEDEEEEEGEEEEEEEEEGEEDGGAEAEDEGAAADAAKASGGGWASSLWTRGEAPAKDARHAQRASVAAATNAAGLSASLAFSSLSEDIVGTDEIKIGLVLTLGGTGAGSASAIAKAAAICTAGLAGDVTQASAGLYVSASAPVDIAKGKGRFSASSSGRHAGGGAATTPVSPTSASSYGAASSSYADMDSGVYQLAVGDDGGVAIVGAGGAVSHHHHHHHHHHHQQQQAQGRSVFSSAASRAASDARLASSSLLGTSPPAASAASSTTSHSLLAFGGGMSAPAGPMLDDLDLFALPGMGALGQARAQEQAAAAAAAAAAESQTLATTARVARQQRMQAQSRAPSRAPITGAASSPRGGAEGGIRAALMAAHTGQPKQQQQQQGATADAAASPPSSGRLSRRLADGGGGAPATTATTADSAAAIDGSSSRHRRHRGQAASSSRPLELGPVVVNATRAALQAGEYDPGTVDDVACCRGCDCGGCGSGEAACIACSDLVSHAIVDAGGHDDVLGARLDMGLPLPGVVIPLRAASAASLFASVGARNTAAAIQAVFFVPVAAAAPPSGGGGMLRTGSSAALVSPYYAPYSSSSLLSGGSASARSSSSTPLHSAAAGRVVGSIASEALRASSTAAPQQNRQPQKPQQQQPQAAAQWASPYDAAASSSGSATAPHLLRHQGGGRGGRRALAPLPPPLPLPWSLRVAFDADTTPFMARVACAAAAGSKAVRRRIDAERASREAAGSQRAAAAASHAAAASAAASSRSPPPLPLVSPRQGSLLTLRQASGAALMQQQQQAAGPGGPLPTHGSVTGLQLGGWSAAAATAAGDGVAPRAGVATSRGVGTGSVTLRRFQPLPPLPIGSPRQPVAASSPVPALPHFMLAASSRDASITTARLLPQQQAPTPYEEEQQRQQQRLLPAAYVAASSMALLPGAAAAAGSSSGSSSGSESGGGGSDDGGGDSSGAEAEEDEAAFGVASRVGFGFGGGGGKGSRRRGGEDAQQRQRRAAAARALAYAYPAPPASLWVGGVTCGSLCRGREGGGAGACLRRAVFAFGRLSRRTTLRPPHARRAAYFAAVAAHLVLLLVEVALAAVLLIQLACVEPAYEAGGGTVVVGSGTQQLGAASPPSCNVVPVILYAAAPPGACLLPPLLGLFSVASRSSRGLRLYAAWNGASLGSAALALGLVAAYAGVLGYRLLALPLALLACKLLAPQCVPVQLAQIETSRAIRGWRGLYEVRNGPVERTLRGNGALLMPPPPGSSRSG